MGGGYYYSAQRVGGEQQQELQNSAPPPKPSPTGQSTAEPPPGQETRTSGNTWLGLQAVPLAKSTLGRQDNIAGSHPGRSPEFPSSEAFGMVLEPTLWDLLLGKLSSGPGDRPRLPLARRKARGRQDPDLSAHSF